MKTYAIESWISLHRFTPGRRSYAARLMKTAARARNLDDVVALCDAIIASEKEQIALQKKWNNQQTAAPAGSWSPELLALDVVLDRQVGQLRDLLAALAALGDSPRSRAAQTLLTAHFARGVAHYTQCIVEDEAARVGELVDALQAAPEDVASATVEESVAAVRATHTTYDALVHDTKPPALTSFKAVKDADLANQRRFLDLVTDVLALTRRLADGDAVRDALLATVVVQDAEIAAALRAKRKLKDVDPDSGTPTDDDATD